MSDRSTPKKPGRLATPETTDTEMILFVCAKLNDIFEQGRNFNWIKPQICPRCGSVRMWGHGFVIAYFDGFTQGLFLRRYRCPGCKCIVRMKVQGYFRRFQASIDTIGCCLEHRLSRGRWRKDLIASRQRHWLSALRRKCMAFFGLGIDLMAGFDRLANKGVIPVSRAI